MKEPITCKELQAFIRNPIVFDMRVKNSLPPCDEETDNIFLNALHVYVLQGEEEYNKQFCVEHTRGCAPCYQNFISRDTHLRILSAAYMVFAHDYARDLLTAPGDVNVEVTADCECVRCTTHIDYVGRKSLFANSRIVELEPTYRIGYMETLLSENDIYQYAFSQIVLASVTGKLLPVYVIAVEFESPYQVAVFKIDDERMKKARDSVLRDLDKYADYLKNGLTMPCIQELRIV